MAVDMPPWVRELGISLVTHPQILLVGNVRDQYLLPRDDRPDQVVPMTLGDVIERACRRRGYGSLLSVDLVRDRMEALDLSDGELPLPDWVTETVADDALSGRTGRGQSAVEPDAEIMRRLRRSLREVVEHQGAPIGLIFPYANRLGSPRAELSGEGKLLMAAAEALGYEAKRVRGANAVMPYNTVFWIAESQEQLPIEFAIAPRTVRVIAVPNSPTDQRIAAVRQVMATITGVPEQDGEHFRKAVRSLAKLTHGLSNAEVLTIGRMAQDQGIPFARLEDAVRLYRVGVRDNPWATDEIRETIRNGEQLLSGMDDQRPRPDETNLIGVIGQSAAVRHAVEIFARSAAGLTGAQSSSSPNRPRGVLFLAGPTGVGKTELAKGVARMLFGRDAEPIRFDMSEFREEHSRQRLIGAPPGYVGFDAGGELTNAVRGNPMSVLLFDEIDKANERLFDLFLQVLEDGRLTDGRGSTVHFTETVLIFTSNLGMVEEGPNKSIINRFSHTDDPEEVRRVLRASFENFFDNKIGRPELRNRLGDAFIAMDFIQPEHVPMLLDRALASVRGRVQNVHQTQLELSDEARAVLLQEAEARLEHGGRGVNNAVEMVLINPLSRVMLREPPSPGEVWTVRSIKPDAGNWTIEVGRCSA
jgi:hypothetical protein